ncbi:MAG TPA: acylneuraminate cytidylyltransferase [Firmicutes bacterium]|nr:acylneuraminate cytidylyltransferase [Bacillota bacterium]
MPALAIIPARGGSKGLPRKNVLPFCGLPLIAWTIKAAQEAKTVGRVVVSTDDAEIAEVSLQYDAEVIWRPKEISGDEAPSEAALLHALSSLGVSEGTLAFLQCTAPLMLPEDIDGTVAALAQADTAFTAVPWHRFIWKKTAAGGEPVAHSKTSRPLRQQREPLFLEVGAVYALDIAGFLTHRHRFFGRVAIHLIDPERSLEIDDHTDFLLAETLMRRQLNRRRAALLPRAPQALVMDFDGVLTDNRVGVDEDGKETVVCHRGDGWAISRLREAGLSLLALTNELNGSVKKRCEKLKIECLATSGPKLPVLKDWLRRRDIDPGAMIYIGNDDPDIPCMQYAACAVAPSDAAEGARRIAQIVLETKGGHGCIRELAELLLPGTV